MYPEELVSPMRAELTRNGFNELKDSQAVIDTFDNMEGTAVLVVNSVCGCASGWRGNE